MLNFILLFVFAAIAFVLWKIVKLPHPSLLTSYRDIEFEIQNTVLVMRSTGGLGQLLHKGKVLVETSSPDWVRCEDQSSWFREVACPIHDPW